MKTLLVITIALSLTACGWVDRFGAGVTGHSKMCVDGVSYIQFTSGATAQLNQAGKPVTCN